jgi:hypothetical protein
MMTGNYDVTAEAKAAGIDEVLHDSVDMDSLIFAVMRHTRSQNKVRVSPKS